MSRWHTLDGVPDLPEHAFQETKIGTRSRMTLEGGGGGGKTESTSYQTNLPEYAQPYYEDMMDRAHEESLKGYIPYEGERIAGFSPNEQYFMNQIYNMQTPGQFGSATMGAADAMNRAANLTADQVADRTMIGYMPERVSARSNYNPMMVADKYGNNSQYQVTEFDPGYTAGEMTARQFTPEEAAYYMSPYMQNVTDIEKRSAISDAMQKENLNNYAAQQAAAFGGSRHGVVEAAHSKDTMQLLDDIQKKGLQESYESGRNQFNSDRQAQMDAQAQTEAWRQAQADFGLRAQDMSEGSRQFLEGINQFGANLAVGDADRALQSYMQDADRQLTADQFNSQQGLANFIQNADRWQQAITGDADRNLQAQTTGIQSLLQGAGLMSDIGTAQSNVEMAQIKLQKATSAEERELAQRELDQAYQDFVNARDYDRQQLAFFGALLRGIPVPVQQETIQYQSSPGVGGQLTGAGLASLGAQMFQQ